MVAIKLQLFLQTVPAYWPVRPPITLQANMKTYTWQNGEGLQMAMQALVTAAGRLFKKKAPKDVCYLDQEVTTTPQSLKGL